MPTKNVSKRDQPPHGKLWGIFLHNFTSDSIDITDEKKVNEMLEERAFSTFNTFYL